MILPDDKDPKIVWDPVKNRYVNKDSSEDNGGEDEKYVAAPPSDTALKQKLQPIMSAASLTGSSGGPPSDGFGMYKRAKPRGARDQYVDVLRGACKPSPAAPSSLFSVLPKSASMPANIFVPNALAANDNDELDAGTRDHQSQQQQQNSMATDVTLQHQRHQQQQQQHPEQMPYPHQIPISSEAPSQPPADVSSRSHSQLPPVAEPPLLSSPPGAPEASSLGHQPAPSTMMPPAAGGPPLMFNPSQFHQPPTNVVPPPVGGGLQYGRPRQYPRKL